MFPAPLEVDRELYSSLLVICTMTSFCFRPLSRQIGIYTKLERKGLRFRKQGFPSPLEVDRCSSNHTDHINKDRKFPAPLEVDRYLYIKSEVGALCYNLKRFRPLSRQIGIYTMIFSGLNLISFLKVSVPSRGRQVSIPHILYVNL